MEFTFLLTLASPEAGEQLQLCFITTLCYLIGLEIFFSVIKIYDLE